MTVTYEKIATSALGSAGAIVFTSIPATYTDLVLVATLAPASAGSSNLIIQVNSDSGGNYSWTKLVGNGSATSSSKNSNYGYCAVGDLGTNVQATIHFQNYANTTTYKTFLSRFGWASVSTGSVTGLWRSTSAINRIELAQDGAPYTFATGSVATLYGIKAE